MGIRVVVSEYTVAYCIDKQSGTIHQGDGQHIIAAAAETQGFEWSN